jgi:hypothetical protein
MKASVTTITMCDAVECIAIDDIPLCVYGIFTVVMEMTIIAAMTPAMATHPCDDDTSSNNMMTYTIQARVHGIVADLDYPVLPQRGLHDEPAPLQEPPHDDVAHVNFNSNPPVAAGEQPCEQQQDGFVARLPALVRRR